MQRVYATFWRHLWPLGLQYIFRHYLKNGAISGKELLNIKCVFLFSLQFLSKKNPITEEFVKNVETSAREVPVILLGFE